MSATYCQRCAHYSYACITPPCDLGHLPRYQKKQNEVQPYGYKRICGSFVAAALQPMWYLKRRFYARATD